MVNRLTTRTSDSTAERAPRPALRAARRAARRALWTNRALVLARRGELAAAERSYTRTLRAAREKFEAAETERLDALRRGRETIASLRRGRKLADCDGLTLYDDRIELPRTTVAMSPDVSAIVGPPSALSMARPAAIARLGAGKDERRLIDDLAAASDRAAYLLIEAGATVCVWHCGASEDAAREFAARINVAALNTEHARRELRAAIREAEAELWRVDAEHEQRALLALSLYQERRDDTQAVERARDDLKAALEGGEEIERLRAGLVQLASD
jgi:hypothetical protein